MTNEVQLESEAREFSAATANPPYLADLGPEKGREAVDEVQSGDITKPDVDIEDVSVAEKSGQQVSVRILRPRNAHQPLPAVIYIHGAGWVFGNAHTHDRLVRELAVGADAAVVFPEYSLSPEAKYPTAIEESYAVTQWVAENGREHGLDADRVVVAGDSVGGNMATAVALMAKERGGPALRGQLLLYPVTEASFDSDSYHEFATGYFLRRDAMMWFWDQYTTDPKERAQITASPLRATIEELRGLPEALVITAEADVLRDHGEAYASKLREAGVRVTAARFGGIIHDFMMINAMANTAATRGAMALSLAWLRERFRQT